MSWSDALVQMKKILDLCLDLNLRLNERGASTQPLCYLFMRGKKESVLNSYTDRHAKWLNIVLFKTQNSWNLDVCFQWTRVSSMMPQERS